MDKYNQIVQTNRGSRINFDLQKVIDPDATIAIPPAVELVWHSEDAGYTDNPQPPIRDGALLRFPVPAAVSLEASR